MIFKLSTSQILHFHQFDEKHCYCTCLGEMFEVNYFRGKYNQSLAAPLMSSIVLKSGIKSCFDGVVFQGVRFSGELR